MASVSSGPSNYRTLRAQPASGSGQSRPSLSLFTPRREKWHPEKLGMANANIDKAWLLWGCLWRASLYELLLGAAFAGFYGAVFGTLAFPVVGTLIGFVFGAPAGALVGLPLGLIDGLLLMIWLTVSTHEDEILNPHRYRLRAGAVCGRKPHRAIGRLGAARLARLQLLRHESYGLPIRLPDRSALRTRRGHADRHGSDDIGDRVLDDGGARLVVYG